MYEVNYSATELPEHLNQGGIPPFFRVYPWHHYCLLFRAIQLLLLFLVFLVRLLLSYYSVPVEPEFMVPLCLEWAEIILYWFQNLFWIYLQLLFLHVVWEWWFAWSRFRRSSFFWYSFLRQQQFFRWLHLIWSMTLKPVAVSWCLQQAFVWWSWKTFQLRIWYLRWCWSCQCHGSG